MPQTQVPEASAVARPQPQFTHRVKVCGITNVEDARLAQELGAWALGMIFYDGSPRRCARSSARVICAELRRRVELCGVFVNAGFEEIEHTTAELGLTLLQLHGDEGPAFCAEIKRRTGARVIKAMQVSDEGDVRELERFHVDFHLLDAPPRTVDGRALRGGTGERFDWKLVRGRRASIPLILSGGLSAANVAEAITAVRPWAVDTASGTESAPGHKDPDRLRAFFQAVGDAGREADPVEER